MEDILEDILADVDGTGGSETINNPDSNIFQEKVLEKEGVPIKSEFERITTVEGSADLYSFAEQENTVEVEKEPASTADEPSAEPSDEKSCEIESFTDSEKKSSSGYKRKYSKDDIGNENDMRRDDRQRPPLIPEVDHTMVFDVTNLTYDEYVKRHYDEMRFRWMVDNGFLPPPMFPGEGPPGMFGGPPNAFVGGHFVGGRGGGRGGGFGRGRGGYGSDSFQWR